LRREKIERIIARAVVLLSSRPKRRDLLLFSANRGSSDNIERFLPTFA